MLKRLFLIFALIFLFGFGQQGAVTHAYSHLADFQQQDQQGDKSHHAPLCDKCVVYAELGSAVASTFFAPPSATLDHIAIDTQHARADSVLQLPYSARAPPYLA